MNQITIHNIHTSLINAIPDPAVGISLAHLLGDKEFSYYVTRIPSQCRLMAHFHRQGDELYQVIEGEGVIRIADAEDKKSSHEPIHYSVLKGDTFIVPKMTVHQLFNPGPEPLIMMFGCPQSHITNDRELVVDFNNPEGER